MKKKTNIYLKVGIWTLLAEILVRAVSFFATPVFSRILPQDIYGIVKTYESWLCIFVPVFSVGLYTNIEIAQYKFKEHFRQYISSTMFLILLLHALIFTVVFLFRAPLCRILKFTPAMLFTAVFYSCFYSCILCQMRAQRILLNYKATALLSVLATVPSMAVSVILCLKAPASLTSTELLDLRILSFYLPVILFGFLLTAVYLLRCRVLIRPDYWKYAVGISAPLIMYQISLQILTQSDRIMIEHMVNPTKAAIFSIATTVIYIVEILNKGLESSWLPWLYRQLDRKENTQVIRALYLILAVFGVIFFYVILLGNEIILFFGGQPYTEAKWLLGPMLAGIIFQFLMLKLIDIEKFYGKGGYVGSVSILISVINLILNYVGIRFGGYQMAAYTTCASYIIAVIIHFILISRQISEIRLPSAPLFGIALLIAVVMIFFMIIYRLSFFIRFGIAAALTIILGCAALHFYRKYGAVRKQ